MVCEEVFWFEWVGMAIFPGCMFFVCIGLACITCTMLIEAYRDWKDKYRL